jgi:hypothetical protein
MCLAFRQRLQRPDDHGFDGLVGDDPGRTDAGLVIQAVQPTFHEAGPPFTHRRFGGPIATRHRGIRDRSRARQHQASAKGEGAIDMGPLRQANQFESFAICHHQRNFGSSDRGHILTRSRSGYLYKVIRFQGTRLRPSVCNS